MKAPVSVCLIVRDEAGNLPNCLGSVLPICADVVVVDTGSQDATPELAGQMGARVFSFAWIDDFSAARNYAADQANQSFILRLDADECLVDDSLPALLDYCRRQPPVAGRVQRTNLMPAGDHVVEYLTCLYPNTPDYRYERRIHEQLRYRGQSPPSVRTDLVLLHTGYAPDVIEAKAARNLRLLELDLAEAPDDAYAHYQVGRTLYAMRDYAGAVGNFKTALELLEGHTEADAAYLPTIFQQQAYAYMYLGDLESTISTISAGVSLFPDYTDLYFVYGLALMRLGGPPRVGDMLAAFEHCLKLGEPDAVRYNTVGGVGSYRAQHNLGAFREALGDRDGAVTYYRQAAARGFEPSIERLRALESQ
jgi:glycosyltransferase involved in cell wall biosynthesis